MKNKSVFSCLKEIQNNFDEDYLQAKRYVKDHFDELSDRFAYASFLEKPLIKNQVLFWGGTWSEFEKSAVGKLFLFLQHDQEKKYTCLFTARNKKEFSEMNKKRIPVVQKNSKEYWEALACSEYLAGSGILPSSFIKRKNQICALFPEQVEETGADRKSLLMKDYLKADFLFTDDKEKFQNIFPFVGESNANIFDVKGLSEPSKIAQILFEKNTDERTQQRNNKKLLLLGSWKDSQENRRLIRFLARLYTNEGYEVTAISPRIADSALEEEFDKTDAAVRFIFRGKMTVTEDEFLLLHILDKYPQLYIRETVIREFLDKLTEREYRRIWGNEKYFNKTVLTGNVNSPLFFLAAGISAEEKILADSSFLTALRDKDAGAWKDCRSLFDEYLLLPDEYESYMNSGDHMYQARLACPCFEQTFQKEVLNLHGEEYLICDEWKDAFGRTQVKLIRFPSENSILINGELMPDKARLEKAGKLLAEYKGDIFVIGKHAGSYIECFPNAVILENYAKRWLPFLPGACLFFSQFSVYLDDDRTEYDVLKTILQPYKNIRISDQEELYEQR